jgi:hypothetical protein
LRGGNLKFAFDHERNRTGINRGLSEVVPVVEFAWLADEKRTRTDQSRVGLDRTRNDQILTNESTT